MFANFLVEGDWVPVAWVESWMQTSWVSGDVLFAEQLGERASSGAKKSP